MAKAPKPAIEVLDSFPQGSDEWYRVRLGLPTASNFSTIMASGKDGGVSLTRTELMYKLAGEILTGEPAENYRSKAMERGNAMEAEARDDYARTHFCELRQVGFVRQKMTLGRYVGASPDALIIGDRDGDGGLEIKTLSPHLLIRHIERGAGMPPEHRAQVFGVMWVANLDFVDLKLYYRKMPQSPVYRVYRDETVIKQIKNEVERFDHELHKIVARMKEA